jgi:hypothetical protein
MTKRKALIIVSCMFLTSVLVRLPNLDRTISKHHEFNTAMVLINMESWRQAGGGSRFHFVPLQNFQHSGDKLPDKSLFAVDSTGNAMYLSFGPAWFILPYAVYELLGLAVKPLYLQLINLLFNLTALFVLFDLLCLLMPATEKDKYAMACLGCFFFLFSPCVLWYLGNGYTNVGIMMPLVILFFRWLLPLLNQTSKFSLQRLLPISLLVLILVYFDWFILGACGVTVAWLLIRTKKHPGQVKLAAALALSCALGVSLLFWQFASHAGWPAVTSYWKSRFGSRSVLNISSSVELAKYFVQNIATAYLPLILMLIGLVMARSKKTVWRFSGNEKLFIGLYGASALLYNLVLFEWSAEHEYGVIPWSPLLAYLAAKWMQSGTHRPQVRKAALVLFFAAALAQYYFINRPGRISREGTPYVSYRSFGDSLRQVPPDYKIFIDLKQDPMIEFYAGRNLTLVDSRDSAWRYMQHWGIARGAWIEHDRFDFKKIIYLERPFFIHTGAR